MAVLSRTNARRLDQRITFQRKALTPSATGAQTTSWVDFVTIWACVDATKASERFNSQQELAGNEYTVWIRWRNDIDPNMRIVWNGILLNVTGIPDNQKRGRFLNVFCESGINQG